MGRWVKVAAADTVAEGAPRAVAVDGWEVALWRVGDAFYATDDLCSHAEASLSEGEQVGYRIICPRHGGQFDMRTGQALRFPAAAPIATFPVRVQDGALWIELPE
ncbi:MAG: non-heme iron oxygenase ferredoxin subunit [Firmicutes bacterium]|nr:non-heme iron oxygenase ferredoxin subunit [Alicyclobacillaceae bacterium]MCL6496648.1 non-heme iron oxygenase ferredoxin subunit [Bacillota bacterium]